MPFVGFGDRRRRVGLGRAELNSTFELVDLVCCRLCDIQATIRQCLNGLQPRENADINAIRPRSHVVVV